MTPEHDAKSSALADLLQAGREWVNARRSAEAFNNETWKRLADAEANLAKAISKAEHDT